MKKMNSTAIGRRAFLTGSTGLFAALALPAAGQEGKDKAKAQEAANEGGEGKLIASAPMLQNAAETSMGIAWAVSANANGFVDISESPDMANSKRVKCGGYRVTGMNDKVIQVRLTGLKPATRYYYRIGADRIEYKGGYAMKRLGTEIDEKVRSFTTLGAAAESRFCVINDTHERPTSMNLVFDKLAELAPPCVIWNGDACNVQETVESLVSVFLNPNVKRKDYAAETPYIFCPGNHDQRGLAARHLEDVVMFRQPEERLSRDWDLGRNFSVRLGDIALIGLDTGEDRPDDAKVGAGLFSNAPYREAQTDWLRDALRRPEIAEAPFLVTFCHIPLYSQKWTEGPVRKRDPMQAWRRRCLEIWGPLLDDAGCQLVVAGHNHKYSYKEKVPGHSWSQIVGGGPDLCRRFDRELKKTVEDEGRFPTVIEGKVEDGMLKVTVHNVYRKTVAGEFKFASRKRS